MTRDRDGTVTVKVLRRAGIAGTNARLHQLGIRAEVPATQVQGSRPATPTSGPDAPMPQGAFTTPHWTNVVDDVTADTTLVLNCRLSSPDESRGH